MEGRQSGSGRSVVLRARLVSSRVRPSVRQESIQLYRPRFKLEMTNPDSEHDVPAAKQSIFQAKKANLTKDDEFDFLSGGVGEFKTERKSTCKEPLDFAELINPHVFSLTRTVLKRDSRANPFGMDVKQVSAEVIKVTHVAEGQAAAKTAIEPDMYVLAFDGKRVKTETEFRLLERSDRKTFRVAVVKRRPVPYQPCAFPMPASIQRLANLQYHMFRLDPTDGVRVGTGIGERGGSVCVTQVVENSAGEKAGVKVGDRVLIVDDKQVDNKETCKNLVQASLGNPFDMVVERLPVVPSDKPSDEGERSQSEAKSTVDDVSRLVDLKIKKKTEQSVRASGSKKGKKAIAIPTATGKGKGGKGGVGKLKLTIDK